MTLLKDNNYKDINIALLSLEADIKKLANFDISAIDKQLVEINERIDEINDSSDSSSDSSSSSSSSSSSGNNSAEINDLRASIENINTKIYTINSNIDDIEQKLSNIFLAENHIEDFNTATEPGIYWWGEDTANRPANYGVLLVNRFDSGTASNWINQTAYSTTGGKIYFRQKVNDIEWRDWSTIAFEDITKTYTIPDVTSITTRYIKLGTFPWHFAETVKVNLIGNNFEDTVEFNVLGGNAGDASVNGWYTTNGGETTGIYVALVAPIAWSSNIEVWLRVEQTTTLTVYLTGNAIAAQYFNTNPQMNYTTTYPSGAKTAATFNMKRGYFGYNENSLNCYDIFMTTLGFTANQVVSVSEFAQALINYTGTIRGQVHFTWDDANKAYIKATAPYNTQLEISGGTVIFHSRNKNVGETWNTFEAQYINRLGEIFTFGIYTDGNNNNNIPEFVRKEVDTSGKVATAGTADTAKGWQVYELNDLKSLSNSNFYPVVIDTGYNFVDVEIYSESVSGHLPYNQNRIKFTISAAGWSDTPKSLFISEYNRFDDNEVTIGCIGYCNEDATKAVIWLRGGLWYTCYTMNCPSALAAKTVDTALGTSIVTVGTSYSGGTNTKVSILFTPDIDMSKGIYSSTGMTTTGNLKVRDNIVGASSSGANLSGYGKEPLSIGDASNLNVGLDYNSMQARNNGAASALYLNYSGGMVNVNGQGLANGGLTVGGNTTLQSSTNGANLSGYGKEPLSIGDATGINLGIDGDDIQVRNNGAASMLDINYYGGLVRVNGQGQANGGLKVCGKLNIPTSAPSNPERGDIWLVL